MTTMKSKEQPFRRLTKDELFELKLNLRIANLEMTIDEAEEEWQHRHNPDMKYQGQEW